MPHLCASKAIGKQHMQLRGQHEDIAAKCTSNHMPAKERREHIWVLAGCELCYASFHGQSCDMRVSSVNMREHLPQGLWLPY